MTLSHWQEGPAGSVGVEREHMFPWRSLSPEEGSGPRGSGMCSSGAPKSARACSRDSATNRVAEVEERWQRGRADGQQALGRQLGA